MSSSSSSAWMPLRCEGGGDATYVYRFDKRPGLYDLCVTDGVQMYSEKLKSHGIEDRCSDLNPAIDEAPANDLVEEISDMLANTSTHIEIVKPDSEVSKSMELTLQGKLFGYDFQWRFQLVRDSPQRFYDNVSKELLGVIGHMFEREKYLTQLLRDKDLEISDYLSTGATLTRKSLKTEPFGRDDLGSKARLDSSSVSVQLLASESFRQTQKVIQCTQSNNGNPTTPTSTRKERKKRIRIKGMKVSDMLKSDDEDNNSEDTDEEPPAKISSSQRPSTMAKDSPTKTQTPNVQIQTQAKKKMAKRLKKL